MNKYAKKLGIGHSSLKMIMAGKRKLTLAQLHRIIQGLKLNASESTYLESLTLRERAKSSSEFEYYSQRAKIAKVTHKLQSHIVSDNELLKDIFIIPILIYLSDFYKNDLVDHSSSLLFKSISKKFGLKKERVETAINILQKLDLLNKSVSDYESHFVFDKLTKFLNQKQYLKAWLIESAKRIESEYSNPQTYFTAVTISLSLSDLAEFKNELKLIFEKYMSLSSDKIPKSQIIQVCVQMFPLLKNIE
jgi:uncharacterized protein (TIGR02147 family)